MQTPFLSRVVWRTSLSVLIFSLAFSPPANARIKRQRPSGHIGHRRAASLLAGPKQLLPGVVRGGPWTEPTYANSTDGDIVEGEDPAVRRIAIDALGLYNGTVVVVDPSNGRILTMVNQRIAVGAGFQPCSTFKVSVALAALCEKVIVPGAPSCVRSGVDLTKALARSNNYFFANLGCELGFDKLSYYAHQFGYGEKAGLNIAGEESGHFPLAPPANGGVSMLSSFGEEISQTPLQLAALMCAIANGGTLYSLQYPRNAKEVACFRPRIKRKLNIDAAISGILPGLQAAVEKGTARGARQDEPIAGKTGTCSENHTHLGWFGAFNDIGRRLVVVVLLTGGRPATGPRAAFIAGEIYRQLDKENYLVPQPEVHPTPLPAPRPSSPHYTFAVALILLCPAILILIWRMLRFRRA
jgi:penicillin-binding protein 2